MILNDSVRDAYTNADNYRYIDPCISVSASPKAADVLAEDRAVSVARVVRGQLVCLSVFSGGATCPVCAPLAGRSVGTGVGWDCSCSLFSLYDRHHDHP